jgi:uncharacterized membrane protein YgcG
MMLKRNLLLQVFIVVALSAIGQASAKGTVVGRKTDLGSSNESGKTLVRNNRDRELGGKGKGKGKGGSSSSSSSKGKGKVS